jgi:hypothetical protein
MSFNVCEYFLILDCWCVRVQCNPQIIQSASLNFLPVVWIGSPHSQASVAPLIPKGETDSTLHTPFPIWSADCLQRRGRSPIAHCVSSAFRLWGVHIGARALLCMVWLYRSPIPVERKGAFNLFKWFLISIPAFAAPRGGWGSRHPLPASCIALYLSLYVPLLFCPHKTMCRRELLESSVIICFLGVPLARV